jgi:hypothetical protein
LATFVVGTDDAVYYRELNDVSEPGKWTPWQSIGALKVRANSNLAVVRSDSDRLDVFAVGPDNALWHARQTGDSGNLMWLPWQSLGGGVAVNTSPVVILDSNFLMQVFVVGTNHELWNISQTVPENNFWSGWHSLGGSLRDNSDPAVDKNVFVDGRLQVFVVGTPNGIYYRSQTSAGSNTWSGWQSLGGEVDPNTSPAALRRVDGIVEVFVLGTNNALYHALLTGPGTPDLGWQSLGGTLRDNSDPVVIRNPDGRLQVFVVAADNSLLYKFQNSRNTIEDWSPYGSLGGVVRTNTSPDSVCSELGNVYCALSPLQVFVAGTDGALWHKWRTG